MLPKQRAHDAKDVVSDSTAVAPLPKKRGRPPKTTSTSIADASAAKVKAEASVPARKRGRPAKSVPSSLTSNTTSFVDNMESLGDMPSSKTAKSNDTVQPRKRGRPPKLTQPMPQPVLSPPARKRGRPRKLAAPPAHASEQPNDSSTLQPHDMKDVGAIQPARKRGRPPKAQTVAHPDPHQEQPPSKRARLTESRDVLEASTGGEPAKKRGRPPKPKPETQAKASPARPRGRPRKTPRVEPTAEAGGADDQLQAEMAAPIEADNDNASASRQYWLMKAEQEDRYETTASGKQVNTKFSIDDLRNVGVEPWDGVRNVVARNNMRAMKKGDLGFFYASQGKQGRQPGITGILEIEKEAEPDWTVEDRDHYSYIPDVKSRLQNGVPRWSLVHVKFRAKLSKPVTLETLKKHAKDEGGLSEMQLFRAARLSVSKVSEREWAFILQNLISVDDAAARDDFLPS
ncbi:DUF55-domain-containing protein [Polychaeton citri CBS 116435]|uniref:DUF55-domain-containing protein n=1 Tax=Polychaeton citri CBS 116435 TaxID=1314669 RepID=A0A9P4Q9S7_9PEZI|nr:DUF55-domain-containing protein [Polychaeton citri CBS 116435]